MESFECRRDLRLLLLGTLVIITACQSKEPLAVDGATALSPGIVETDAAVAAEGPTSTIPPGRACATGADCSWWQEPDSLRQCCSGECANTRDDVENCGGCGHRCAADEMCVAGTCASAAEACGSLTCDAGLICCAGACVRPSVDYGNCGACGVACRFDGASCLAGVCCPGTDPMAACRTPVCPKGQVQCADGCRDLGNDSQHCGACDRGCSSKLPRCAAGLCTR
jgi:hypothetical protein